MTETNRLLLGVNIDHIATLRQARGTPYPDLVEAARIVEAAGADSITLHLREDRRHIQDVDVHALRERITTAMNLEMAATDEMVEIALRIRPEECCLVPERREELTTEGGLDVIGQEERLRSVCARLCDAGIQVSLFIEPDPFHLDAAARIGAPVVELHTGAYANAIGAEQARLLDVLRVATAHGCDTGLVINAGHGLDYGNVCPVVAIPGLHTLNIGHSIICRAVIDGLYRAVADMRCLMECAG